MGLDKRKGGQSHLGLLFLKHHTITKARHRTHQQLQQFRRALIGVMGISGSSSIAARAAREAGHKAYTEAFADEEKAKVLALAQKLQDLAPADLWLRSEPRFISYHQAVKAMGTSLIDEAFGPEA